MPRVWRARLLGLRKPRAPKGRPVIAIA